MNHESPFTITRFEYERKHLYYLSGKIAEELENQMPTYLVGSRGTGKTTLLKALHWEQRMTNSSLRHQLKEDPFQKRCIGVYLKLPDIQLKSFDEWLSTTTESTYGWVLGLFLDLIWVELAADAVAELLAEGVLKAKPEQEHNFVSEVAEEYADMIPLLFRGKGPFTVTHLAKAVGSMKRNLERGASQKVSPESLAGKYPLGQVGSFGKNVGKKMAALCDLGFAPEEQGWHFKICMDEGECLNRFQQRVVNTLVRLSEWPAFPVVAFVSVPEDPVTTLVPNLTLQKADRQLRVLDTMDDAEFKELAAGVATVRIQTWLKDAGANFDIAKVLGPLNINGLLHDMLRTSVRPKAKTLLEESFQRSKEPFLKELEGLDAGTDADVAVTQPSSPPIYQTYLIKELGIKVPAPNTPQWERRRQDSAEIRKRMVAAYLSVCSELGKDVRYASGEMVLQMSDKCMRDFLAQLESVFRESGKPLPDFLQGAVPSMIQDAALKHASIQKRESLPNSGVAAPKETGRIVDGLAKLTAIVQTRGRANQHLRSSERGIFDVKLDAATAANLPLELELVKDATEAGFLKLVECTESTWRFRVHASLAAAYGFSYRGAYYACRLTRTDLQELCQAKDPDVLGEVVKTLGNKLSGQEPDDLPLFKGTKK